MTKKTIDIQLEDITYSLEGPLSTARRTIDRLIHKYGGNARLVMWVDESYEVPQIVVEVRGEREETDQEYTSRLETEATHERIKEKREREEFKRLRAKFTDIKE